MRGKLALALILLAVGICAFIFYMKRTVIVPGGLEITFKGSSTETVRVFYDRGKGYKEEQAVSASLTGAEDETLAIKLPSVSIRGIRVFMGGQGSAISISSICYSDLATESCWGPQEIVTDFAPVRDISDFRAVEGALHIKSSGLTPHFEYKGDFRRLQSVLRKDFMMMAVGALAIALLPMLFISIERSEGEGSVLGPFEPVWTTIKVIVVAAAIVVVIAGAGEGLILLGLRNQNFYAKLPEQAKRVVRDVYAKQVEPKPQYMLNCSHYDRELFYTLQAGGSCSLGTREFNVELRPNSLGVRDSEAALRAPEVVVLGDSTAMGYGVESAEAFPARLGKLLGKRVLDAAVPSYGTAREVMMLRRIDMADARTLVIQYSPDDFDENEWFMKNGGAMPVRGADQYTSLVSVHSADTDYFFGKYLLGVLKKAERLFRRPYPQAAASAEAKLFMQVISTADLSLVDRVVVIEVWRGPHDREFVDALAAEIRKSAPELEGRIMPIDVSKYLGEEHFFAIDGHLNAKGHDVVARVMAAALKEAQ